MITYEQTLDIFKTLPIGYYLGKGIEAKLDEHEEASYFDPIDNHIVVSYPMIAKLKESKGEQDIRNLLYHELSHVILTPKDLMFYANNWGAKDIVNIFEDERIETLFKHYYLNTNFKQFVKRVCEWDEKTADPSKMDTMGKYYACVRFDYGTKELVEMKNNIIEKWKDINATTNYWDFYQYLNDIRDFYNKFGNNIESMKQNIKNYERYKQSCESTSKDYEKNISDLKDEINKETEESIKQSLEKQKGSYQRAKRKYDKAIKEYDENIQRLSEQIKMAEDSMKSENIKPQGEFKASKEMDKSIIESIVNKIKSRYINEEMVEELKKLLFQKTSKNRDCGGITSYTGKINPRLIARDHDKNYKWSERQHESGEARVGDKIKINLFIDESGSMSGNVEKVNTLIKTIAFLKSQYKNFDYSINTIGCVTTHRPKNYLYKASGGNILDSQLPKVFRENQTNGWTNYNIVMFDGQCYDGYNYQNQKELFKTFNKPNVILICEPQNERLVNDTITQAKSIITNNYLEEFETNILSLLKQALR